MVGGKSKTMVFLIAALSSQVLCSPLFGVDGLISYWKFDEGGGATACDSIGTNDGTIYGANWTTGVLGTALGFDGVDDYVQCPQTGPLGSSPRTVCAWARTSSTAAEIILSYGGLSESYGSTFRMGLNYWGLEGVFADISGGNMTYCVTVADGEWHHYAAVVPSTPAPTIRDVRVYQDATLLTGACQWFNPGQQIDTLAVHPINIGRFHHQYLQLGWIQLFNGSIDEVRVYDRALTDEEIRSLAMQRDLSVESIRPVQTVWNSDIDGDDRTDLVLGKETAVEVRVRTEGTFAWDEFVTVELTFGDEVLTDTVRIGNLSTRPAIFYPVGPAQPGWQPVLAMVDSDNMIDEANEDNNIEILETGVTVRDTGPFGLAYFPLRQPGSEQALEFFSETAAKSAAFIRAVYPIAPQDFSQDITYDTVSGAACGKLDKQKGMIADLKEIEKRAKALGKKIGVGIVGPDYFSYHGEPSDTVGFCAIREVKGAVLVREQYWAAPAHEIGHLYGLEDEAYEGNLADGFWVSLGERREFKRCFMVGEKAKRGYDWAWVCDGCYRQLFEAFLAKKDK